MVSCNQKEVEIYKCKSLTTVLSKIYSEYINVDEEDLRETTTFVMSVFKIIVKRMCREDPLFAKMYQRTKISGSVADSLKVLLPDEYDLNLVLKLPECFTIFSSNIPGYIHLKERDNIDDIEYVNYLPKYLKSTKDCYFLPRQLLMWIEFLLQRVLYSFPNKKIRTKYGDFEIYFVEIRPGFTFKLCNCKGVISVDVVPCFEVNGCNLPEKYNKQISKGKCQIIPKVPRRDIPSTEKYWRLCFQDYERLTLRHKSVLKPAIKLLKALKEKMRIPGICSYHIKAICLYEVQKSRHDFWKYSLGNCFLRLLKACIQHLKNGEIPAIYDRRCNIIERFNIDLNLPASKFQSILDEIVNNSDTSIIAKYFLDNERHFLEFKDNFHFSHDYSNILILQKLIRKPVTIYHFQPDFVFVKTYYPK